MWALLTDSHSLTSILGSTAHHLWFWTSSLKSLSLSFLIYKVGKMMPSTEWEWGEMICRKHLAQSLVQRRVSIDGSHVCCCSCGRCCFVIIVPVIIIISDSFISFVLVHGFEWEKKISPFCLTFSWNLAFPCSKNAGNRLQGYYHYDFVTIEITDLFISPDSCCRHLKTSPIALWNDSSYLTLHQISVFKALLKEYKYYYDILFKYLINITM